MSSMIGKDATMMIGSYMNDESEIQEGRMEWLEEVHDDIATFDRYITLLTDECKKDKSKKIDNVQIEKIYLLLYPIMDSVSVVYRAVKEEEDKKMIL